MNNRSIVVIDDNNAEIKLIETAMKNANYKDPVEIFHDSTTAFDYIRVHRKDISMIICDINMPKMTGIELLEKINANKELKLECVPFIFLSNSASNEEVKHAYSLAAQGYFQKPLGLEELSHIIKTIIDYWKLARIPKDGE